MAAQNLRDNKNNLNNIILLGMSISVLLMIYTLSQSIINDTVNYYKEVKYDITFWTWPANRSTENKLLSVDGVMDTYGEYFKYGETQVMGKNTEIKSILGVNKNKTLDYLILDIEGDAEKLVKELDEGRNIIITNIFKDEHGIKKGDYLKLKTEKGVFEYKVIGFIESNRSEGKFALIGERFLKSDMSVKEYSDIYIKTNKDRRGSEEHSGKIQKQKSLVRSVEQSMKRTWKQTAKYWGYLTALELWHWLFVFGVFNNLIISFIDRKRSRYYAFCWNE